MQVQFINILNRLSLVKKTNKQKNDYVEFIKVFFLQ